MKKLALGILLIIATGSANAHFRCNTERCKQARLADKQNRLERIIASTNKKELKEKSEIELETVISELERMDQKQTSTASAE
jgi:hypothetical protein